MTSTKPQLHLAREEFVIVSMLSWFHLIVESDNSVIVDLKANAGSPEERLRKVGERVNLPPHSQSEAFFRLSAPMSALFKRIEVGDFITTLAVPALWDSSVPNNLHDAMLEIINQWSAATGRDMKAQRTTVTPRTMPSSNGLGRRPVPTTTR